MCVRVLLVSQCGTSGEGVTVM